MSARPLGPDPLGRDGRVDPLRADDLCDDLRLDLRLDLSRDVSGGGDRRGYADRGGDAEDDGDALHGVPLSRPIRHEPRVEAPRLRVVRARDIANVTVVTQFGPLDTPCCPCYKWVEAVRPTIRNYVPNSGDWFTWNAEDWWLER